MPIFAFPIPTWIRENIKVCLDKTWVELEQSTQNCTSIHRTFDMVNKQCLPDQCRFYQTVTGFSQTFKRTGLTKIVTGQNDHLCNIFLNVMYKQILTGQIWVWTRQFGLWPVLIENAALNFLFIFWSLDSKAFTGHLVRLSVCFYQSDCIFTSQDRWNWDTFCRDCKKKIIQLLYFQICMILTSFTCITDSVFFPLPRSILVCSSTNWIIDSSDSSGFWNDKSWKDVFCADRFRLYLTSLSHVH